MDSRNGFFGNILRWEFIKEKRIIFKTFKSSHPSTFTFYSVVKAAVLHLKNTMAASETVESVLDPSMEAEEEEAPKVT